MNQKKYVDIERLKDKYASAFTTGEHITVTEKIDGANASIRCDVDGNVYAFSRRNPLNELNHLQGFWNYVQTLDVDLLFNVLRDRYILFGEWLVKHTIKYPDEMYRQFYVFDVWDTEIEQYVPWALTYQIANALGLKTVPLIYDGEFHNWDELYAFVGKTQLGAEPTGEGIVIKSQDRLDNKFSGTPAYVKIVAKEFSEVHQSKPHEVDPEKLAARQVAVDLVATVVTERRIEKIIQKFIEDGVLREDWDEHDMGVLAKILPKAVYEDCRKEEPETVVQCEDFGKISAKLAMSFARGLIK